MLRTLAHVAKPTLQHAAIASFRAAALSCTLGVVILPPHAAQAQTQTSAQQAALLADSVVFDGTQLIASGHVDVLYGDVHLTAAQITFDQSTGSLTITGPITLTQGADGSTVILASAAEMDEQLRNGVLHSAQVVIDQQLQLASQRIDRIDGRYTRLGRTVTSACKVCANNPTPLWQIRAKEVIHDSQERQLYFTDAQFRLWDVPVFYLPHLRLPDPSLKRATGFLIPRLRTSSTIGTGVELPYFIAIGDHQDVTLTPFISTDIKSLGVTYRQAYINGDLEVSGALSYENDTNETRGYLFADAEWRLNDRWTYGFDLKSTSDISYLLDYDIYDLDRLSSTVWINSYSQNEAFDAQLFSIETLRESEVDIEDTLPFLLGELSYEKSFTPGTLGGTAWIGASAAGHYRASDGDDDGTDILRLSAETGWDNSYIASSGLRFDTQAELAADAYYIAQSSTFDSTVARLTPSVGLRTSYPLERTTASGSYQSLTPILQLSWAKSYGGDVPNTDSVLSEFDEGNLFALSQYSGSDRRGSGARAALGVNFAHIGSALEYELTFGRILSFETSTDYTDASGLSSSRSDFLLAASVSLSDALAIDSRALFDTDLSLSKWETRFDLNRDKYALGAVHSYVIADADEDRDEDLSEVTLSGALQLSQSWEASADYRYNFSEDIAATAAMTLTYKNECTEVDFGLSRRYADTDALDPTNSYSLSVSFGAFGTGSDQSNIQCGS
jgi:LPS-assembly protein